MHNNTIHFPLRVREARPVAIDVFHLKNKQINDYSRCRGV